MRDIYHSNNISVVVDNNVLVDLFELGCLNLLFQVFDNVMIPQILYASEVQDNVKLELQNFNFSLANIETEIGYSTYQILVTNPEYQRLSRYDKFAISIAKEKIYYCNSNDLPVRKTCEQLGVNYTGVLGVLGRAYIKAVITEDNLRHYLNKLLSDETSCYIKEKLIRDFEIEIFSV